MMEKPTSLRLDVVRTYAERLAQEAEERRQQRQRDLIEQSSAAHSPEDRIRAWEKIHALHLPVGAEHPVLDVIAQDTGLTLEQIRAEQGTRRARRTQPTQDPAAG